MTKGLEQSGDSAFEYALKQANIYLGLLEQAVNNFDGSIYDFPKLTESVSRHLNEDISKVRESSKLSEAGAADLELLFDDLETTSESLYRAFVIKKPTIQCTSNSNVTLDSLRTLLVFSEGLVSAIVYKTDLDAKYLVEDYAKQYLKNIRSALVVAGGMKDEAPR